MDARAIARRRLQLPPAKYRSISAAVGADAFPLIPSQSFTPTRCSLIRNFGGNMARQKNFQMSAHSGTDTNQSRYLTSTSAFK
jgi:hypothetical protein